jgi:hypothetical protein
MRGDKNEENFLEVIKEIMGAYTARIQVIDETIKDTHLMMKAFQERRDLMTGQLQELLACNTHLRKKDFASMMNAILARQREREQEVRALLEDFKGEEELVVNKLKSVLQKGGKVRIKDFKNLLVHIKEAQEKRMRAMNQSVEAELHKMREEVEGMLQRFKEERQSVANAWQEALNLFRQQKE